MKEAAHCYKASMTAVTVHDTDLITHSTSLQVIDTNGLGSLHHNCGNGDICTFCQLSPTDSTSVTKAAKTHQVNHSSMIPSMNGATTTVGHVCLSVSMCL